jgi:hypothetical protein
VSPSLPGNTTSENEINLTTGIDQRGAFTHEDAIELDSRMPLRSGNRRLRTSGLSSTTSTTR